MWPLQWTQVQPCPDLHLPPVNEFIPTEFDLKPREAEVRQPQPLVLFLPTIHMLASHEAVVNNIFEQAPKVPVKLIGNDMMELWFKQDDRFNVPKMECRFVLCDFFFSFSLLGFHLIWFFFIACRLAVVSPVAYDSPAHSVMSYLFVELLEVLAPPPLLWLPPRVFRSQSVCEA